MLVGTLCFAVERGLGHLAKSFYDAELIQEVAVLEHGRIPSHPEWYPECLHITSKPWLNESLKRLIECVDIMLFFETPFDWDIIQYCREVGTKSVLMVMHEFTPEEIPHEPDLYLCPSLLDLKYFPNGVYVPLPVDNRVKWRKREVAKTFVHNAGYVGFRGRHGTLELLQSLQYVESDIQITIRAQEHGKINKMISEVPSVKRDNRVEIEIGHIPYDRLWTADVCIDPEKFNGASLPLQEARASGMLVISTNRFPVNTWLPNEWLIEPKGYIEARTAGRFLPYEECVLDPKTIAAKIDEAFGTDIGAYSEEGLEYKTEHSWSNLKQRYTEVFEDVLTATQDDTFTRQTN